MFAFAPLARADKFELVAGGGTGGAGRPAVDAKLGQVFGVEHDPAGNLFVVEYTNRLWKIDPKGVITPAAGNGTKGGAGDGGPAVAAQVNVPHSIAVDADGNVFVGDTGNFKVRKVDAKTGAIAAFAGTGEKGTDGNGGPAAAATFGGIYCVAFNPAKTVLIITDLDHKQIRAVDMKTGVVSLVAGNGKGGVPADGADAKTSPLVDPRAATMDADGNVYVLERGGHALRVVDPQGKIKTVVGTGKKGIGGDGGPALQAQLNGPKHLCVTADGAVLIADTENHVVRRYDPKTGTITRVGGTGQRGKGAPGNDPLKTELSQPHGVYQAKDGTVYVCDSMNGRVLKIVK
ncbi:MAG TPA: hypothetical protein VF796_03690 [Humisphaera sp.]